MRANFLPSPSLALTLVHNSFILLAGALVCLSPLALSAQSVSFAGTAVNFGSVNICPAGQTTPAPCSATMTLTFTVTASGTLGTPKVLTLGAPNLDFTLAPGSTCVGSVTEGNSCTVNVTFAPRFAGQRLGGVEIVGGSDNLLADVPVYGTGSGPQVTFQPGTRTTLASGDTSDFVNPVDIAVDGNGNVFVAGQRNTAVKEILAAGGYTTVNTLGSGFDNPNGIAVDGSGNVFVSDYFNHAVKELPAAGGYTTIKTLVSGNDFNGPQDISIDGSGNLFVPISGNGTVVEIFAAEEYTTYKILSSGFTYPIGMALDGSGNIFIADFYAGNAVKEILAAGGYTTVKTLGSGFNGPIGVALDASGNVFVADLYNNAVKEILAVGGYTKVNTVTSFPSPYCLALDSSGNLFVGSYNQNEIDKLDYADPPSVVFPTPTFIGSKDTADGAQTVSVWNSGSQPLLFATPGGSNPDYPEEFPANTNDTSLCAVGTSLTPGVSCDVSMNFVPAATGPQTGSVTLTDNAFNANNATQVISLSGTGKVPPPEAEVSTNLLQFNTIAFGSTETIPLTITNIGEGALIFSQSINGQSFTIAASNCAAGGLAPGGSCTLQVEFSPVTMGTHDDLLTLLTNGPSNPTVKLKGVASGVGSPIKVLEFGTIAAYTTAVRSLIITNFDVPGTVTIGTAIDGNSFTILTTAENTCLAGVASGQSCTLPVEFLANSVGAHNEQLTLTPSGGAAASAVHLDAIEAAP